MIHLVFRDGSKMEVKMLQKLRGIQRKGYRPVDIVVDNSVVINTFEEYHWYSNMLLPTTAAGTDINKIRDRFIVEYDVDKYTVDYVDRYGNDWNTVD